MKKKIYIIIGITLFLVAAILATREIVKNVEIEGKVKQGYEKLSDEAKKALNYDELLADIKAKKDGKEFIYAKKPQESNNNKGKISFFGDYYKGTGYYYAEESGGEWIGYGFYSSVDKIEIYGGSCFFPMEEYDTFREFKRNIEKHPYETAAIVVVIIGLISCIIVYIKNKKEQSKSSN